MNDALQLAFTGAGAVPIIIGIVAALKAILTCFPHRELSRRAISASSARLRGGGSV